MSDKPAEIVEVVPRNVAKFHAVYWNGDPEDAGLAWMVQQFGWRKGSCFTKDGKASAITIYGRHGKRYVVQRGWWVVALGANGSLRVLTNRDFVRDYALDL